MGSKGLQIAGASVRIWRLTLCCVVLCLPLQSVWAVVYRFDSPAELDD